MYSTKLINLPHFQNQVITFVCTDIFARSTRYLWSFEIAVEPRDIKSIHNKYPEASRSQAVTNVLYTLDLVITIVILYILYFSYDTISSGALIMVANKF